MKLPSPLHGHMDYIQPSETMPLKSPLELLANACNKLESDMMNSANKPILNSSSKPALMQQENQNKPSASPPASHLPIRLAPTRSSTESISSISQQRSSIPEQLRPTIPDHLRSSIPEHLRSSISQHSQHMSDHSQLRPNISEHSQHLSEHALLRPNIPEQYLIGRSFPESVNVSEQSEKQGPARQQSPQPLDLQRASPVTKASPEMASSPKTAPSPPASTTLSTTPQSDQGRPPFPPGIAPSDLQKLLPPGTSVDFQKLYSPAKTSSVDLSIPRSSPNVSHSSFSTTPSLSRSSPNLPMSAPSASSISPRVLASSPLTTSTLSTPTSISKDVPSGLSNFPKPLSKTPSASPNLISRPAISPILPRSSMSGSPRLSSTANNPISSVIPPTSASSHPSLAALHGGPGLPAGFPPGLASLGYPSYLGLGGGLQPQSSSPCTDPMCRDPSCPTFALRSAQTQILMMGGLGGLGLPGGSVPLGYPYGMPGALPPGMALPGGMPPSMAAGLSPTMAAGLPPGFAGLPPTMMAGLPPSIAGMFAQSLPSGFPPTGYTPVTLSGLPSSNPFLPPTSLPTVTTASSSTPTIGGTSPYMCSWMQGRDFCGRRFNSSEELMAHLRSHTSSMGEPANALSLLQAAAGKNPPSSMGEASAALSQLQAQAARSQPSPLGEPTSALALLQAQAAQIRAEQPISTPPPTSSLQSDPRFHPYARPGHSSAPPSSAYLRPGMTTAPPSTSPAYPPHLGSQTLPPHLGSPNLPGLPPSFYTPKASLPVHP